MEIKRATENLIGTVWTLEYILNDDETIVIDSFTRDNAIGYAEEKQLPRLSMQEADGRIVTGVYLQPNNGASWADKSTATLHKVVNPKFVFSYKKGSAFTFYEMRKKKSDKEDTVLRSYGELVLVGTPYGKWFNANISKMSPLNQHYMEQLIDGQERYKSNDEETTK